MYMAGKEGGGFIHAGRQDGRGADNFRGKNGFLLNNN